MSLMDEKIGRFDGPASFDDDYFVEDWSPLDNQERFTENFIDELHQTLSKPED